MRSLIAVFFGVAIAATAPLRAQGIHDPTGPVPRYQAPQPLPSNTARPTVNRQSNGFSPGAPTPRMHGYYRFRQGDYGF
jgi:hypothetical protein